MKLIDWMELNKLGDAALAKKLGFKRPDNVRRWKNDEFRPSEQNMKKLLSLTEGKVTPNDFFGGVQ